MKRLFYLTGVSNDTKIGNYIKEDFINLKAIFEPYENSGKLILRTDELLTSDLLAKRIAESEECPWLFYFSGHSDENQINLIDKDVKIAAFANLFDSDRIREELQLVFLNSCTSEHLGDALIDFGVKVVLVSKTIVSAPTANLMARKFFNKLMIESNIYSAYKYAEDYFEMKFSQIDFSNNEDKKVVFPWVLKSSSETNLDKKLPKTPMSIELKNTMISNELEIDMEFDKLIIQYSQENNLKVKKVEMTNNVNSIKSSLLDGKKKVNKNLSLKNIYKELLENQTSVSPSLDKLISKSTKKIKSYSKSDKLINYTSQTFEHTLEKSEELLKIIEKI